MTEAGLGCSAGPGALLALRSPEILDLQRRLATLETQLVGLVATVVDARGQALAGATVEWTSSDPGIMAIVSGVRVTAFQDGAVTLTARSGALAARSTGLVRQQVAALRWLTTPTDLLEGEAPAEIKIEVRDRRGHPVVNATEPVTVRLSGGPGLLTGPSQQIPVRGVADFAATTISAAGINYRLTAASDGVPSVTTAFFPVQHRFAVLWVGWTMNCARDLAGLTWCWGQNYRSLLLIPGDLDVFQPTRSPALDAFPVLHTSGFPCATSAAGLFCWGSVASPPLSQPQLIATGSSITGISTGKQGCGSRASVMVCWGAFGPGQSISPIAIPGPPQLQIVTTGVGLAHYCGLTPSGAAYCAGNNPSGEIGNGTTLSNPALTAVAGGIVFAEIDGGLEHTCGLARLHAIYCWGSNQRGQLGDSTLGPRSTIPVQVVTPMPLTTLSVGQDHGCGLGVDQRAYCWGRGWNGELGTGHDHYQDYQVQQVPLPDRVRSVGAGWFHSCALTFRGQVLCWGDNSIGQRGTGAYQDPYSPSPVGVAP